MCKIEQDRDAGKTRRAGRKVWTVEGRLLHWVENIAGPFVKENTARGYRVAVTHHLVPGVGKHRLDKLAPEHLERLYVSMMEAGSSAGTAHQAHRTIRTALNEAVRRRYITSNPASLAKVPRLVGEEVEPYTVDEVRRILEVAAEGRTSARWAVALALGLRQGEALALRWPDVDLDTGTLIVRRNRLRPKWPHGCNSPCGRRYPGYCPDRKPARDESVETKSRAGRRSIGLPDELVTLLRKYVTSRTGNGRLPASSGRTRAGSSRRPPADRPTIAATTTSGSACSARPAYGTAGCTTPDTPPRRSCRSSAS